VTAELWIPAGRLLEVVDRHPNPTRTLAGHNCERTLRAVRAGKQKFVSLRAADAIMIRLGMLEWWHIPKDEGGLADIYEDGAQYGRPHDVPRVPGDGTVRYGSEEERVEARRKTWRESKRRRET
jgi:hypothetical protein